MTRRTAWAVVAASAVLIAWCAWRASALRSDSSSRIFLRGDDSLLVAYDRFTREFGEDTFVLVTCRGDGSPAFRSRVEELAASLGAEPPLAGSPLTRAANLESGDGRRLTLAFALADGPRGLAGVDATLARFADLSPALAGAPVLNQALREASDSVARRLLPLLALIMATLLWAAYRSARALACVLVVTTASILAGMAVLALFDRPINLISILLPVLLLTLTVALCIHLMNAYRHLLAGGLSTEVAVRRMRATEFRPCLITTLTTSAGFGSFLFSRIDPLRVLGIAMGAGFLIAFAYAFVLLPALLVLVRPSPREGMPIGAGLRHIVPRLVGNRALTAGILAATLAVPLLSLPHIRRETNAIRYLAADHPLRVEHDRLEREGVGTASVEAVFSDTAAAESFAAAAARLREEAGEHVCGVISAGTLLAEAGSRAGSASAAAIARFRENLARFAGAGRARVSVLVDTVADEEWRALRTRLEALAGQAARGGTFEITGELPLVMAVQESLLSTLISSIAGTALTICAILAVAHRSLRDAACMVLAGAPPLAFVVGACALLGIPLTVATVMVLAVVMGIVTDDSVHLLDVFRSGLPLREAMSRVGTPVTETSIVIFTGFAVLGWAEFRPTRHFALLTAAAMAVALFADLVVFPTLIGVKPERDT